MSHDHEPESAPVPEREGESPAAATFEERRRSFLKTCLAVAGGALVYATPVVKAYAQTGPLSPPPPVFDVDLPAVYTSTGSSLDLQVTLPGQGPVPVPFQGNGGTVSLLATDDPDVADILVDGVRFESVDPQPFEQTGRLTVVVPRRTIGQLNLRTGAVTATEVPFTLSSERGPTTQELNHLAGVQAQERPSGPKCVVLSGNDVSLSAVTLSQGGTATGPLTLGLAPSTVVF